MHSYDDSFTWILSIYILRLFVAEVSDSFSPSLDSHFVIYTVVLDTPLDYSLDDCIEYIQEDELVEVTPQSIRMCKNPKLAKKGKWN